MFNDILFIFHVISISKKWIFRCLAFPGRVGTLPLAGFNWNSDGLTKNVREHRCPGQLGVDALAGGVQGQAGEGHGWRQPVFVAELCRCHPMELLHLGEVYLGGHQHTWDVALHVVLLRKRHEKVVGGEICWELMEYLLYVRQETNFFFHWPQ